MKFNFAITGVSIKVPEVQVASTDLFGGMDVVMGQNEFAVQGVQFGAEISGAELFDVVGAASVQTSNLLEHAKDIYEYVTEDTTINRLVKAVNQIEDADTNLSIKTLANTKLRMQAEDKFGIRIASEKAPKERFEQQEVSEDEVPAEFRVRAVLKEKVATPVAVEETYYHEKA